MVNWTANTFAPGVFSATIEKQEDTEEMESQLPGIQTDPLCVSSHIPSLEPGWTYMKKKSVADVQQISKLLTSSKARKQSREVWVREMAQLVKYLDAGTRT